MAVRGAGLFFPRKPETLLGDTPVQFNLQPIEKTITAFLLLGISLCAVIVTAGCVNPEETGPADTLYLGNVVTMDDKNPTAEAVAVKD